MFHPKGELAHDNIRPLIRMVEVEGIPLPILKPCLIPPPEEYPKVGIGIDMMGVEMLDKLMDGNDYTTDIP
jgi:hypothetical protein